MFAYVCDCILDVCACVVLSECEILVWECGIIINNWIDRINIYFGISFSV